MINLPISVIIPTYNCAQYLPITIKSVIEQTYQDWEIIIIDDGSTDNTVEVVKPYLFYNNIHFIRQHNQGPAAARNLGIAKATGKYVAFLDADDLWDKRKLELQLAFASESNTGIVLSSIIRFQDSPSESNCYGLTEPPQYINAINYFESIVNIDDRHMANFCTALIPKTALIDIGCYDTSLTTAEDWDLWLRLASTQKYRFINILQPLVYYRKHPESLTRKYHFTRTFRNQLCVLDKIQKSKNVVCDSINRSKIQKHIFFFEKTLIHECYYEAFKIWLSALKLLPFYQCILSICLLKWPARILLNSLRRNKSF